VTDPKPQRRKPNFDNLFFYGAAKDFMDEYRFDAELIKDVVKHPTDRSRDERSVEVGYNIWRFRRGDITVVVGFKDIENPMILFIYLHDPEDHTRGSSGSRTSGGPATKDPTSVRALQTWLQNQGCTIDWDRKSGGMTVSWKGDFVGNLHLTPHTSGASLKNQFHHFRRVLTRMKTEHVLRQDIDLREKRDDQ
jgi:hypothetical protein